MQPDEKLVSSLLLMLQKKTIRDFLHLLIKKEGMTYNQMRAAFGNIYGIEKLQSGMFAYYLRKFVVRKIIVKDRNLNVYYLSRIGVQAVRLVERFEKICMTYDLTDCDADGKVTLKIKGRRL